MNKPTLINLDNSLDDNYVYDSLGSNQHSLLHALIRIFNKLQYPESAIIPNKTLEHKSGIPSRTFHRTRESLIQYTIDSNNPDSWIVKYEPSNHGTAGRYWLNYSYILSNYKTPTSDLHDTNINTTTQLQHDIITPTSDLQDTCNPLQKNDENGNIHRIDKNRTDENRKENILLSSDSQISDDEINKRYEKVKTTIIRNCPNFRVANITMGNAIKKICTYPEDRINIVIEKAGLSGQQPDRILGYIQRGLDNFDEWYADDVPQKAPVIIEESEYDLAKRFFWSIVNNELNYKQFIDKGELYIGACFVHREVESALAELEKSPEFKTEIEQQHPEVLQSLYDMDELAGQLVSEGRRHDHC